MKKKLFAVLILVLIITSISVPVVFAHGNDEIGNQGAITSMFDAMRDWLQQEKDSGDITEEEAQDWEDHFNDMEEYHEESGFGGHCGGTENDDSDGIEQNQYRMPGNGYGMM